MILGSVNAIREAVIQIVVLNDRKRTISIKGVVDTGYTGDLILPMSMIEQLELPVQGVQNAVLGDGSSRMLNVYTGLVIWDGDIRKVEVNAADTGVLVGMGLIENHKLEIVAKPGGRVTISAIEVD